MFQFEVCAFVFFVFSFIVVEFLGLVIILALFHLIKRILIVFIVINDSSISSLQYYH